MAVRELVDRRSILRCPIDSTSPVPCPDNNQLDLHGRAGNACDRPSAPLSNPQRAASKNAPFPAAEMPRRHLYTVRQLKQNPQQGRIDDGPETALSPTFLLIFKRSNDRTNISSCQLHRHDGRPRWQVGSHQFLDTAASISPPYRSNVSPVNGWADAPLSLRSVALAASPGSGMSRLDADGAARVVSTTRWTSPLIRSSNAIFEHIDEGERVTSDPCR